MIANLPMRLSCRCLWTVALTAVLVLGGCESLREVTDRVTTWQGPSRETGAPPDIPMRKPQPLPAPAPETRPAPAPDAEAPAGAAVEIPDIAAPREGEGVTVLTPPPGVVPVTRVALLVPLSGREARLGQGLLNAAQLALFSVAEEDFALLPIDTGGTPEGAAAAARAAVEQGARLILGPLFSQSVAAVGPIARAHGIQVVSFSNDRTAAGDGVYVMGFTPEVQVGRIVEYARSRGVARVLALVPEGAYGDRVEQSLWAAARALGMEVREVARYAGTETEALAPVVRRIADYDARRKVLLDRRKELEKRKDEASRRALKRLEGLDTLGDVDFDAVLVPEGGAALRSLAPLLAFYDVDPRRVRLLGSVQWDDPAIATEPTLYGGWFPAPPPDTRGAFEDLYRRTYGEPPPRLASLAYDAAALAAVLARGRPGGGLRVAGEAPRPLPGRITAEDLTTANGFAGVDGIFRLLPSGLVERRLVVKEVRERAFEVVSPAPATFQEFGN